MNKWNNKFRYQVASCWLFILSYFRRSGTVWRETKERKLREHFGMDICHRCKKKTKTSYILRSYGPRAIAVNNAAPPPPPNAHQPKDRRFPTPHKLHEDGDVCTSHNHQVFVIFLLSISPLFFCNIGLSFLSLYFPYTF